MRSFDLETSFNIRAVVPEQFLETMRAAAQAEDATEFLMRAQCMHPSDNDEFLLVLLRHALRRIVRGAVLDEFHRVGIGGTFSPAKVVGEPRGAALAPEVDVSALEEGHAV